MNLHFNIAIFVLGVAVYFLTIEYKCEDRELRRIMYRETWIWSLSLIVLFSFL